MKKSENISEDRQKYLRKIKLRKIEILATQIFVVVAFIAMLMGTGGNAGSQTSVSVIRALSLGDIEFKDILKVIWKELRVSVIVGIVLGIVLFSKVIHYFITNSSTYSNKKCN